MSLSLARQSSSSSSYSSRSISNSSVSKGMQLVGGGQTRISTGGIFQDRAPSMYGGAGGYGTRISQSYSIFSSGAQNGAFNESAVIIRDEVKIVCVRTLEAANRTLELQIREYYEKRAPSVSKDFSAYFATIADLRAQIMRRYTDNQRIILQIDNAQLATDDFRLKYETELNLRSMVEADVLRLRGVRDSMTLAISDLEVQIEGLKEELVYMRRAHEEEMTALRAQQTGSVSVEVDSPAPVDLTEILREVREQYEALVVKNKQELEKWFQSKVATLQTEILQRTTEVKTFYTELSELKRTYQSLEISRQSVLTEIQCLQQNLEEVKSRYSVQLSQLQMTINVLETELQQLKVALEQQQSEYNLLLDIKMRLEMEIAEYRRLLDGELRERGLAVVISKVVEVEEQKPHIERRVKTIVEEIVDGRVVSSTTDTQVEDIQ
ncbi:hypothetical protein ABVT39_006857 [Epinephelus coioides]